MNPNRTFEVKEAIVPPTFPSHTDVERHLAKVRQLRAEVTAEVLASAYRAVARPLRAATARWTRWRQERQTYQALMHCSDRVLADIGIEREDVALIAKGIDPRAPTASHTLSGGWWQALRVRLDAAQRVRRDRRRVQRELMAYSNRELDDLGVRRADIPRIASGRLPDWA